MQHDNPQSTATTNGTSGHTAGKYTEVPGTYSPDWLSRMDSRYGLVKFMQSRFDGIAADLGGADKLSTMQRSLIERFLWLEYFLHMQEQELASGKPFDAAKWIQGANSLQGIASKLGLSRVARKIPSLAEVIHHQKAAS